MKAETMKNAEETLKRMQEQEGTETYPTEKILNEVEVVEATTIEETKKRSVTAKTIGAFSTQLDRMIEDKLLDTEEGKSMKALLDKAKERWISKMFK